MSVRSRLRDATQSAHADLESRISLDRRLETRSGYVRLLEGLRAAHGALDAALDAFGPGMPVANLEDRRKTAWLDADLRVLRPGALPEPPSEPRGLPVPRTVGEAMGMLYVAEGSTLGGRQIASRIAALGLDAGRGGRFFHGYGARTGAMWRAFVATLEGLADDPTEIERAVVSARMTFEHFGRCIDHADAIAAARLQATRQPVRRPEARDVRTLTRGGGP